MTEMRATTDADICETPNMTLVGLLSSAIALERRRDPHVNPSLGLCSSTSQMMATRASREQEHGTQDQSILHIIDDALSILELASRDGMTEM